MEKKIKIELTQKQLNSVIAMIYFKLNLLLEKSLDTKEEIKLLELFNRGNEK